LATSLRTTWRRFPFFAYLTAKDSLSAAASPFSPGRPRVWDDSIEAGIRWLCLSHDVTGRKGCSGGFSLMRGWGDAFPETTGYILQTLLEYGLRKANPEHVGRACQMGDWEIDVQNRDGGVIHGDYTGERKPSSVFNTGMVMHGWLDLHEAGKGIRYLEAAVRAGRFLAEKQDHDGIWRGEIEYNDIPHTYNARTSWALLRLAEVTDEDSFRQAALRQLDWVLSTQQPNGWFEWCIFRLNTQPNTHAIAYTLRGLVESYAITGHEAYLRAAVTTSLALIEKLERHGKLAGNFDRAWHPAAWYECLTGTAQLGGVWMRLYEITAEQRFLDAGLKAIGIAASRQSRVDWAPIRGALAGSYPIYGRYAPFRFPNWATKFLVDGLMKRADILGENALGPNLADATI
jgi:uncharacterized protein YyaL (SSP411 family)